MMETLVIYFTGPDSYYPDKVMHSAPPVQFSSNSRREAEFAGLCVRVQKCISARRESQNKGGN